MKSKILISVALIAGIIYLFAAKIVTIDHLKQSFSALNDVISSLDPIFEDFLDSTSNTANDVIKDAKEDVENVE
ncbi:MAG: hypothetical protein MK137_03355 [Rickettsiales bacterium]|nr:hypothetical protein [Rickettsiales bacterium]